MRGDEMAEDKGVQHTARLCANKGDQEGAHQFLIRGIIVSDKEVDGGSGGGSEIASTGAVHPLLSRHITIELEQINAEGDAGAAAIGSS